MGIDISLYDPCLPSSDARYEENLIEKIKLAYYEAGEISNSTVIPVGIAFEIACRKIQTSSFIFLTERIQQC